MDGSDRKKLFKAGFRILRVNGTQIREMTESGSWRAVSTHDTIAETNRALARLRVDDKTILEHDMNGKTGG